MQWIPFAMVRITAVFTTGVLTGIFFPQFLNPFTASLLFLGLGLSYYPAYSTLNRSPSLKIITGVLGLTTIFIGGYLNVFLRDESHLPDHLLVSQDNILATQFKVIGSLEEREKSWKRIAQVEYIRTERGWQAASGKVNVYWPKADPVAHLDYGDRIIVKGGPRRIEGTLNPHEFDFQKFMGFKNIFHQQYVRQDEWELIHKSEERGFLFLAYRCRTWAVEALKKFIHARHEQGIAVALVLGVTDGIDDELRSAYAASGAMHVLAVSGLHVSIIYGILLFAFRFLTYVRGGQWLIAGVCLSVLWAYSFITGLSPSVLRAVAMFSFMAVAKPFGRRTNIYNTLAASAFCLLVYDPFLIMSVGFQLSYLAVVGIVCLYRPVYNLLEPKSAIMNWGWQITAVSIAAQIATIPLTICYFHQFPVYSLVSNLFVIPGSFVVLVGGLFLLFISPFTSWAAGYGKIFEWFVRIFNDAIFWVEKLPSSLIENIYISSAQAFLLALIIIVILLLFHFRKFRFVILLAILVTLFSVLSWEHGLNNARQHSWTVYAIKGHSAMQWKDGRNVFFLSDSVLHEDAEAIRFHIQPDRLVRGSFCIQSITKHQLANRKGLYFNRWRGKTFLWIDSKSHRLPESLKVDYLVISNNAVSSLQELVGHVTFEKLIIDGSNSFPYGDRLVKEAQSQNLDHSFLLREGSFTVKL